MKKKYVTVFTPTYNRVNDIKNLYNSLLKQTNKNFEWIVVDDGSTDNTGDYLKKVISEKKISIKYIPQQNSGKHNAVNKGVDIATGEYFAIVDSDDTLLPEAIDTIIKWFDQIKKTDLKFAGVASQRGYDINHPIGTTFVGDYIDAKNTDREKYGMTGDKFEIYYTQVLRDNKFPCFSGEKFLSEITLWNRLARKGYLIRWHQDILYICNYQDGGLTNNIVSHLANSPKGFALCIKEQVKYDKISLKKKMSYYSLYYRIRKNKVSIGCIAKELDTNVMLIFLSCIVRYCYEKIKK